MKITPHVIWINLLQNIYITYRGYSVSFDDDEFIKYIIVSEENLEIIKDVEKQLEEKIDKFIV